MKLNFVYTSFAVLLIAIISMGNSGGRATVAGSGNTGAPGDAGSTCISCHGGSTDIEVGLDIAITDGDGNSIEKYVPGTVYNGSVTINPTMGAPAAYGFQIVAINAALNEDGESVNTFANPSANTQLATIANGRQYAEHNGPSGTDNVFTFEWTAPEANSGTVTFSSIPVATGLTSTAATEETMRLVVPSNSSNAPSPWRTLAAKPT